RPVSKEAPPTAQAPSTAEVPKEGILAERAAAEDVPRRLPAGARVGRYVLEAWMGEGAFGDVYKAVDPQLERHVALKIAKPASLTTPARRERFLGDAKAASRLRHPHIVPVYDAGVYDDGQEGGRIFIASALVEGQSLASRLASGKLERA